jgi:glycosyltransferase involved in cell wall biosynthesis
MRIDSMQTPDVLMVSCKWAQEICNKYGIDAEVVPMGVDRDIFKPELRKLNNSFEVLNCGKWEVRKGHDILAEVFAEAFPDEKDVGLNLLTANPFLTNEETSAWRQYYYDTVGAGRVTCYGSIDTHQDVARIMNDCTIGIFPSRAEGWNMEALEMLSCGKHIIITNYSAHTEYCTKENSFLIDIDNLEPAYDGKWFFGESQWVEIGHKQKKDMVEALRFYYEQWKQGKVLLNSSGIQTAIDLSWVKTELLT